MRINQVNLDKLQKSYQQNEKKIKQKQAQRKHDKMDISNQGKKMRQIKEKLDELPDVREDRIAELKEKIEQGEYKVDSEQLARKILNDFRQE